jgi:hypothetical protein
MSRLQLQPRGFIPDIAFGREPSNSTGGTFTHVDASFPSAHPNSEVGGEKAGQIEQLMRGSGGEDSNFGEVGIFHAKICSMNGMCFLSPPKLRRAKARVSGQLGPTLLLQEMSLPVVLRVADSPLPVEPPFDRGSAN